MSEADFFDVLGQMSEFKCPACGAVTSGYVETCEACGAELDREKDSSPFDLLAGGEARAARVQKIAMHEAKNLNRLKEAREGLASGALTRDDFLAEVDSVLVMIESALELYQSGYMKKQLAGMEPEAAQVYAQLAAAAAEMQAGLKKMLAPDDLAQVDAGLQAVEAALWKVDAAQDVALARSAEQGE